jgi:hypothetical protein
LRYLFGRGSREIHTENVLLKDDFGTTEREVPSRRWIIELALRGTVDGTKLTAEFEVCLDRVTRLLTIQGRPGRLTPETVHLLQCVLMRKLLIIFVVRVPNRVCKYGSTRDVELRR